MGDAGDAGDVDLLVGGDIACAKISSVADLAVVQAVLYLDVLTLAACLNLDRANLVFESSYVVLSSFCRLLALWRSACKTHI